MNVATGMPLLQSRRNAFQTSPAVVNDGARQGRCNGIGATLGSSCVILRAPVEHHGSVAYPTVNGVDATAVAPVELPPPHPTIVPATDLGGVGVLKHGNLYFLSDPFGDVHPDSRGLGLYDLDTRVLSCAVLRINGVRPTLLRAQSAANHISTIQLTNPESRKDPATKQGSYAGTGDARDLGDAAALDRWRARRADRDHQLQRRRAAGPARHGARCRCGGHLRGSRARARATRPLSPDPRDARLDRLRLRGARRPGPAHGDLVHARRGQRERGPHRGRPGRVRRRRGLGPRPLGPRRRTGRQGWDHVGGGDGPVADARSHARRRGDAGATRPISDRP